MKFCFWFFSQIIPTKKFKSVIFLKGRREGSGACCFLETGSIAVDKINGFRLKPRTRCNNSTVCSEIPFINDNFSSLNKFTNSKNELQFNVQHVYSTNWPAAVNQHYFSSLLFYSSWKSGLCITLQLNVLLWNWG